MRIVDQRRHTRWHAIWDGNPILIRPEEYGSIPIDQSIDLLSAPNARPYIVYPFTAESGWTFNTAFRCRDHVAKIYLTYAEITTGLALRDDLGSFILIDVWSKHPNLRWPIEAWQALVDHRRDLTFVQQIYNSVPWLTGSNVVHVATPSFRAACGVLAAAAVYVRGESGMNHAAAALSIPNVAIWGGCMNYDVMGGYPQQIAIGVSPPYCGSYMPCGHCAAIMAGIPMLDVSSAIDRALAGV